MLAARGRAEGEREPTIDGEQYHRASCLLPTELELLALTLTLALYRSPSRRMTGEDKERVESLSLSASSTRTNHSSLVTRQLISHGYSLPLALSLCHSSPPSDSPVIASSRTWTSMVSSTRSLSLSRAPSRLCQLNPLCLIQMKWTIKLSIQREKITVQLLPLALALLHTRSLSPSQTT